MRIELEKKKNMTKIFTTVVLAMTLSMSLQATSIPLPGSNGTPAYAYSYNGWSEIYSYGNFNKGGNSGFFEFVGYGSQSLTTGWVYDDYYNSKTTMTTYLYGTLNNIKYNASTGRFTGTFYNGYDYTYSNRTGQWIYTSLVGLHFVDSTNITLNNYGGGYSYGGGTNRGGSISSMTTPEPGTLLLLGTGLVGIGLVTRKKSNQAAAVA
jgi:hypothetical protein